MSSELSYYPSMPADDHEFGRPAATGRTGATPNIADRFAESVGPLEFSTSPRTHRATVGRLLRRVAPQSTPPSRALSTGTRPGAHHRHAADQHPELPRHRVRQRPGQDGTADRDVAGQRRPGLGGQALPGRAAAHVVGGDGLLLRRLVRGHARDAPPQTFGAAMSLMGYFRPEFGPAYDPLTGGVGSYDLAHVARTAPPPVSLWLMASKDDPTAYPQLVSFLKSVRSPMAVTSACRGYGRYGRHDPARGPPPGMLSWAAVGAARLHSLQAGQLHRPARTRAGEGCPCVWRRSAAAHSATTATDERRGGVVGGLGDDPADDALRRQVEHPDLLELGHLGGVRHVAVDDRARALGRQR